MLLGDDRLSTTDEHGRRVFLYPAEVRGFFKKNRNWVDIVLILFFLILPWLKWNGVQLLLLDIPHRTFHIGGLVFKAHDAPLIFLVLAASTISLAFITAIFGRVWCGWACPQTVFVDGVYRRIESWIQGNYIARRKLAQQKWNLEKIRKIGFTWFLFFVVSAFIAHSFVAYFVGSDRLIEMMQGSPKENWTAFVIVMGMTLLLLFDFGWFREQFCIIACPYGRIQSVLMDKKSMSIMYDYKRGEPRKSAEITKEKQGDCINCRRCIEVCPTGIDIRRGIQLECIGCTSCIDACDEIMTKIQKPIGLIRYASEHEIENSEKLSFKQRILRPRVLAYLVAIAVASSVLAYLISIREPVLVNVLKAKEAPYTMIKEQNSDFILNHFKLHVHNQSTDSAKVVVRPISDVEMIIPRNEFELNANQSEDVHFFVKFPMTMSKELSGKFKRSLEIEVLTPQGSKVHQKEITIVGPF